MGLLDYYRQFEDLDESEVNRDLRERRARERAVALERVPVLDLSSTEWHDLPNADVVSASVYQARGRINGYPDPNATAVKRALSERHYIRGEQIVFGNGAAELLKTAVYLLLSAGDEVVVLRPSHPVFSTIAAQAGARLVEVPIGETGASIEALLAAVGPRTRAVLLCNPNDPTGGYLRSDAVAELAARLPEHAHLLLDEAYIQYQEVEDEDACLRLVELFPRLLVFRTFSKAYGLSGLRAGYVIGSPAATSFIGSLAPEFGVNALTQAAVLQALRVGDRELERRRPVVLGQRALLFEGFASLPLEATPSQANFVWLRAASMGGDELATRLEQTRVLVAPGGPLGDDRFVRAAIRNEHATNRLLWSLHEVLDERAADTAPARATQASGF
jgi:histidinol-phosphate aminotransferase